LWALLICFVGLCFIGGMVSVFGFMGFFWGIVLGVGLAWLIGYLLREGHLGTEVEDIVLAIPIFGGLYERVFKPSTYYKTDTTLMFQSVVHTAVLEVVDQVLSALGGLMWRSLKCLKSHSAPRLREGRCSISWSRRSKREMPMA
jgi:hypothetical protein